jgi:homoserine/homoserine lactone efflux protein
VFKTVGAIYLVYLGWRQWTSKSSMFDAPLPEQTQTGKTNAALFRQGLLVALTNPKSILFFTALFPQFIRPEAPVLPQFLALTSAFAACVLTSHLAYVLMARHTHRWFGTPRRARIFNRLCGGAFGLLGLSLLRLKSPQ